MKYLGFTCTKILAGLKCRSHSTLVKSVQVTAPLINITIETTQIVCTVLQHFTKRLGPGDTLNAVHEIIFIMVTCSLGCGKVTSNLDPLQKFLFKVIQPSVCKFY